MEKYIPSRRRAGAEVLSPRFETIEHRLEEIRLDGPTCYAQQKELERQRRALQKSRDRNSRKRGSCGNRRGNDFHKSYLRDDEDVGLQEGSSYHRRRSSNEKRHLCGCCCGPSTTMSSRHETRTGLSSVETTSDSIDNDATHVTSRERHTTNTTHSTARSTKRLNLVDWTGRIVPPGVIIPPRNANIGDEETDQVALQRIRLARFKRPSLEDVLMGVTKQPSSRTPNNREPNYRPPPPEESFRHLEAALDAANTPRTTAPNSKIPLPPSGGFLRKPAVPQDMPTSVRPPSPGPHFRSVTIPTPAAPPAARPAPGPRLPIATAHTLPPWIKARASDLIPLSSSTAHVAHIATPRIVGPGGVQQAPARQISVPLPPQMLGHASTHRGSRTAAPGWLQWPMQQATAATAAATDRLRSELADFADRKIAENDHLVSELAEFADRKIADHQSALVPAGAVGVPAGGMVELHDAQSISDSPFFTLHVPPGGYAASTNLDPVPFQQKQQQQQHQQVNRHLTRGYDYSPIGTSVALPEPSTLYLDGHKGVDRPTTPPVDFKFPAGYIGQSHAPAVAPQRESLSRFEQQPSGAPILSNTPGCAQEGLVSHFLDDQDSGGSSSAFCTPEFPTVASAELNGYQRESSWDDRVDESTRRLSGESAKANADSAGHAGDRKHDSGMVGTKHHGSRAIDASTFSDRLAVLGEAAHASQNGLRHSHPDHERQGESSARLSRTVAETGASLPSGCSRDETNSSRSSTNAGDCVGSGEIRRGSWLRRRNNDSNRKLANRAVEGTTDSRSDAVRGDADGGPFSAAGPDIGERWVTTEWTESHGSPWETDADALADAGEGRKDAGDRVASSCSSRRSMEECIDAFLTSMEGCDNDSMRKVAKILTDSTKLVAQTIVNQTPKAAALPVGGETERLQRAKVELRGVPRKTDANLGQIVGMHDILIEKNESLCAENITLRQNVAAAERLRLSLESKLEELSNQVCLLLKADEARDGEVHPAEVTHFSRRDSKSRRRTSPDRIPPGASGRSKRRGVSAKQQLC